MRHLPIITSFVLFIVAVAGLSMPVFFAFQQLFSVFILLCLLVAGFLLDWT